MLSSETDNLTNVTATDSVAAHLRSLEEQLFDPHIRAQPERVAALLTDGFREYGSSGQIYTKHEILEHLSHEPPQALHLTDFACERVMPQTALVTYRSHRTAQSGEVVSALRSSLWLLQGGCWRMHFHQGTKA